MGRTVAHGQLLPGLVGAGERTDGRIIRLAPVHTDTHKGTV